MNALKKEVLENMTFEEIQLAKERLNGIINSTPLIKSEYFSNEVGNQVYIKPENLQLTGAFKIRGAYNKIAKLTDDEKARGLICSSAGNHAQGVAYAAQKLGVKATIVMPNTTPLIKVEATRSYGANVILEGDVYDEAYAEARRLEKEEGYVFVHPFNDYDVMAGQGTIGLEIYEDLKDVDCVLVPIGGGGLISGIAVALKNLNPDIRVIGVEPDGAMAMKLSMDEDRLITLDEVDTIADGVAVKIPGDRTFEIIRDYVDEIVTVSDYEIMEAFLILLERHKLIAENAGILSLAGLKKLDHIKDKKIACVVSGGNIDVVTISSMINKGLVVRGRIYRFKVELPDTPGQLLKISQVLCDHNANVIKLDHNQFRTLDRFKNVTLHVTIETNGHDHLKEILKALESEGFTITPEL